MPTVKGGARRWVGFCLLAVIAGFAGAAMLRNDVSLLTTHGSSMYPHFRTGDLAITVAADAYRVGDVAAYRAEPNGAIVLHRIIASRGGRFTFKGDNNTWKDPTHPRPDELVGKLWIRIPGAGVIADYTSAPGRSVLLAGGVFLLILGGGATRRRRRRRGAGAATRSNGPRPAALRLPPSSELGELAAAHAWPAVAVAGALLLLVISFTRPDVRETTQKRDFSQKVTYGYTGTAPTGTTYPAGTLTTGSPIFLRLVQQIKFQIGYQLVADDPVHNAAGIYTIDAELSGVGSWTHTINLQPSTRFSGPGFSTEVTVDVPQIQALVAATQAETGVKGDNVMIDLVPRVTTNGFAGSVPISATFDTPMRLKLTPLDITPVKAPDDKSKGLGETTSTTYRAPVERPRNLTFLGRSMSVARVRLLAAVAAFAALGWLGHASATYRRLRRESEGARIAHRYQSSLVAVTAVPPTAPAVEVADMAALARIADRCERLILHHVHDGLHTFLVEDDGTAYRFTVVDEADAGVAPSTREPVHQRAPEPAAESPPPQPSPTEHEPEPEPEPHPLAGLFAASEDASLDGAGFHAMLAAGGFLDDPGLTHPPFVPDHAGVPEEIVDHDAGTPPPFFGVPPNGPPPPPTLDHAIRLTPLTAAERAELTMDTAVDPPA